MSPEDQHEPREKARRLSAGDASRLLLIGLPRSHRPIDEVIDRLGGPNGADWLTDAIAAVTGIPTDSWDVSTGTPVPLEDLEAAKERAKDAMTAAANRENVAAATAAYFISIAAAVSMHDAVISKQSQSELTESMAELAAVAPNPWAALFQRSADTLGAKRPP